MIDKKEILKEMLEQLNYLFSDEPENNLSEEEMHNYIDGLIDEYGKMTGNTPHPIRKEMSDRLIYWTRYFNDTFPNSPNKYISGEIGR